MQRYYNFKRLKIMAVILDDIYNEMKLSLNNELRKMIQEPSQALAMLKRYRNNSEQNTYNINDQEDLTYLVSHGMTATEIARFISTNSTYVTIDSKGQTTAEPIEAIQSKVISKSGYILAEIIRNPSANINLYNSCVVPCLPGYIESIANSGR